MLLLPAAARIDRYSTEMAHGMAGGKAAFNGDNYMYSYRQGYCSDVCRQARKYGIKASFSGSLFGGVCRRDVPCQHVYNGESSGSHTRTWDVSWRPGAAEQTRASLAGN